MSDLTLEYDENTNPAEPDVLIRCDKPDDLYQSTRKVLRWKAVADADATKAALPIIELEEMLAELKVPNPPCLGPAGPDPCPFATTCLFVDTIKLWVDQLADAGAFTEKADDGTREVYVWTSRTALYRRCDKLLLKMEADGVDLSLDEEDFDAVEDFGAGTPASCNWLNAMHLDQVTAATGNLRVYVELSKALGPRGLDAARNVGSQFEQVGRAQSASGSGVRSAARGGEKHTCELVVDHCCLARSRH